MPLHLGRDGMVVGAAGALVGRVLDHVPAVLVLVGELAGLAKVAAGDGSGEFEGGVIFTEVAFVVVVVVALGGAVTAFILIRRGLKK